MRERTMESRKTQKMFLVLMMFFAAFLVTVMPSKVFAAQKGYLINNANTTVYKNTALTQYYGAIFGSDEVTINAIGKTYCIVTYKTTGTNTKTGYIRTSAILTATSGKSYYAKARTTVYTRPGGKTYGAVFVKDKVLVLNSVSGYTQIRYPVGSTGNSYKFGFVKNTELGNITGRKATTYYVKTKAGLILRSSRSTSSGKLTTMPYGAAVSVYSISNGWAEVSYGGKNGYASSAYLSTTKPSSSGQNSTGNRKNLSTALYNSSSAHITCGFDGYTTTSGRHEGIDIKWYNGASIYALADGEVVRTAYGKSGSGGLSTIAVYCPAFNKTIIYLHSNPVSGLYAGKKITKGQLLGTEGYRGISSASGSHTHVEVRNGRQGYASVSVGDYRLDNANPTSFWNSLGYNVR